MKVKLVKKKPLRKLYSDTWATTDALGRSLPGYDEVGPIKENRYVGIFYFITHNNPDVEGPFNVTEIIRENPQNPQWGSGSHYWGEPEIGYYLNNEEWAIRKHAYLLVDAGVDVIIMDVTNNITYPETYLTICKVFEEMRQEGEQTPDIAFLGSEISTNKLWNEFYSKGLYKDLWFQWKGKPLLLYGQHETAERSLINDIDFSEEIKSFFNLRQSWAWTTLPWYEEGKDEWPWLDHYPQSGSWHKNPNEREMIPVSVAQHPLSNIGRSFHNFHQPETNEYDVAPATGKGLYFQEQWDRALEVDPKFVFVTGWNEWSAGMQTMGRNVGRELQKWDFYPGAHLGKVGEELKPGDIYFIDQYNQEYSRDIEPMKGGHTDNYYYQLMANIRRYKGVNEPKVASKNIIIDITGDFNQWENVEIVYYDHSGDTAHRNSQKQGNAGPYVNTLGRNDILETRVAKDENNVYFYVKTKKAITNHNDKNWMFLLIDTHQDKSTGWEGYDLLVNGNGIGERQTPVKKYDKENGWIKVKEVPYRLGGNELMLSVPNKFIKTNDNCSFDFHWVDNSEKLESIIDFFSAGDNAPSRRANYRYGE